jgi:pyroglutamyl-peptidase
MPRVLLTSFEPFAGFALNSSHEVARAVSARPPDEVELDWLVLPVVSGLCVRRAWQRALDSRPDMILALGQATGAAKVRLEDRGTNLDDFSLPDNAGQQPRKQPIVPGGPAHLRTTAPVEVLLVELIAAGFCVEHSLSAGSYVCNHLYYSLLHHAGESSAPPCVLFVHLPLLPGQAPAARPLPARPLDEMAEVVRHVLRVCSC